MEPKQLLTNAMDGVVNVRRYIDQPVPDDVEQQLLYAFSLGPSLANTQPWELLMVEDREHRKKLVDSTLDPFLTKHSFGSQSWIAEAPVLFIALLEKRRALARLGETGIPFAVQDLSAAIQNFRLMAAFNGLCTSCVREFDSARLKENFQLPWYLEPVAVVTAGYSEEMKEIPPRLAVQDIVHRERWA